MKEDALNLAVKTITCFGTSSASIVGISFGLVKTLS